jgi:hypothetical protein
VVRVLSSATALDQIDVYQTAASVLKQKLNATADAMHVLLARIRLKS